jgi:hypothetical protein
MTITIKKTYVYWAAIVVLQILFIAWYQGLLTLDTVKPSALVMTEAEARLTRQAIELVREDMESMRTTAHVLDALRSHLPSRVRDAVMNELGEPDMEFMRDALDILEGKLP